MLKPLLWLLAIALVRTGEPPNARRRSTGRNSEQNSRTIQVIGPPSAQLQATLNASFRGGVGVASNDCRHGQLSQQQVQGVSYGWCNLSRDLVSAAAFDFESVTLGNVPAYGSPLSIEISGKCRSTNESLDTFRALPLTISYTITKHNASELLHATEETAACSYCSPSGQPDPSSYRLSCLGLTSRAFTDGDCAHLTRAVEPKEFKWTGSSVLAVGEPFDSIGFLHVHVIVSDSRCKIGGLKIVLPIRVDDRPNPENFQTLLRLRDFNSCLGCDGNADWNIAWCNGPGQGLRLVEVTRASLEGADQFDSANFRFMMGIELRHATNYMGRQLLLQATIDQWDADTMAWKRTYGDKEPVSICQKSGFWGLWGSKYYTKFSFIGLRDDLFNGKCGKCVVSGLYQLTSNQFLRGKPFDIDNGFVCLNIEFYVQGSPVAIGDVRLIMLLGKHQRPDTLPIGTTMPGTTTPDHRVGAGRPVDGSSTNLALIQQLEGNGPTGAYSWSEVYSMNKLMHDLYTANKLDRQYAEDEKLDKAYTAVSISGDVKFYWRSRSNLWTNIRWQMVHFRSISIKQTPMVDNLFTIQVSFEAFSSERTKYAIRVNVAKWDNSQSQFMETLSVQQSAANKLGDQLAFLGIVNDCWFEQMRNMNMGTPRNKLGCFKGESVIASGHPLHTEQTAMFRIQLHVFVTIHATNQVGAATIYVPVFV